MQSDEIHAHIHKTYFTLRVGLAVLAAALPILLVVVGYLGYSISLQPSLSDYYFALTNAKPTLWNFPMRGWFVGILCAIGSFLILYRGFSNTENWLLNIAGVSALGVALVPMLTQCKDCGGPVFPWWPWAHFFFAGLLFVCIAFVAWACSEETLGELPPDKQKKYRTLYDCHALGMLLFPFAAIVLTTLAGMNNYLIFFIEAFGVWVFAHYWYTKSRELQESDADKKAAQGRMAGPSRERTSSPRDARWHAAAASTGPRLFR
jgi:hypothetical protein